ncbi:alanine racemase 1 [Gammaproteobacteria bacterium]
MTRPTVVIIDQSAFRHNLERVRIAAPNKKVMAILKANAYGHRLAGLADVFQEADAFGVACIPEAEALRTWTNKPITLLEGVFEASEYPIAASLGLSVVIHHRWQIDALASAHLPVLISVWLKIDSGMHRLGLSPEEAKDVWKRLQSCPWVIQPTGWMTHFACADARNSPMTAHQLQSFQKSVAGLPGEHCLANSAAILSVPEAHCDWVRPGLMLYGISPFLGETASSLGLRPVMHFRSTLIAIRNVKRGETVGYGGAWESPTDTTIGTIAAGYADGYPRHAPSGTPVLVNGYRVPLAGRVSMDMLCVDLKEYPEAKIGDPVILWGENLPVEEVATAAGTIPYELLCHIAPRVKVEVKKS